MFAGLSISGTGAPTFDDNLSGSDMNDDFTGDDEEEKLITPPNSPATKRKGAPIDDGISSKKQRSDPADDIRIKEILFQVRGPPSFPSFLLMIIN